MDKLYPKKRSFMAKRVVYFVNYGACDNLSKHPKRRNLVGAVDDLRQHPKKRSFVDASAYLVNPSLFVVIVIEIR